MPLQTINIGASANDGTGDPLHTAMDKINDNFALLDRLPLRIGGIFGARLYLIDR